MIKLFNRLDAVVFGLMLKTELLFRRMVGTVHDSRSSKSRKGSKHNKVNQV